MGRLIMHPQTLADLLRRFEPQPVGEFCGIPLYAQEDPRAVLCDWLKRNTVAPSSLTPRTPALP